MRTRSIYFSHYQFLTPTSCFLDSPELAPGAILGSSGATVSASGTRSGATSSPVSESSSAVKPTSSPSSKSSSNTGAIVGGVVGGLVVISLAAVAIVFFLRRRRQDAPAVTPPVVDTSQPPMDEVQQPLRMDDGYASSSIPGTIGTSSIPGTIGISSMSPLAPMRIYVRFSCPISRRASVCSSHARSCPFFFFFFLTLRTRMILLRSLGTKKFLSHRPRLLREPYRHSVEQETPWPRCRPHGYRVTMAYPPSDFVLRSHHITA